jgi:hypothetical protein
MKRHAVALLLALAGCGHVTLAAPVAKTHVTEAMEAESVLIQAALGPKAHSSDDLTDKPSYQLPCTAPRVCLQPSDATNAVDQTALTNSSSADATNHLKHDLKMRAFKAVVALPTTIETPLTDSEGKKIHPREEGANTNRGVRRAMEGNWALVGSR